MTLCNNVLGSDVSRLNGLDCVSHCLVLFSAYNQQDAGIFSIHLTVQFTFCSIKIHLQYSVTYKTVCHMWQNTSAHLLHQMSVIHGLSVGKEYDLCQNGLHLILLQNISGQVNIQCNFIPQLNGRKCLRQLFVSLNLAYL